MVEVQVDDRPVVAADGAPSAGLLHEHPLDLLMAAGDRLADAPFAAPPFPAPTGPVESELGTPVS
jgi:hypothetical protein